jgi:dynein heavy chain
LQDESIFIDIIHYLFPNLNLVAKEHDILVTNIKEQLTEQNLQIDETQINKIIQIKETTNIRNGIMILGKTGTGKTTCLDTLRLVYNSLSE